MIFEGTTNEGTTNFRKAAEQNSLPSGQYIPFCIQLNRFNMRYPENHRIGETT